MRREGCQAGTHCRLEKQHLDWLITSRSPVQVRHLQPDLPRDRHTVGRFRRLNQCRRGGELEAGHLEFLAEGIGIARHRPQAQRTKAEATITTAHPHRWR